MDVRLGELDSQVTQATDTDDADLLARPAAVTLERRVHGQASAHERGGVNRGEGVGDFEDEVLVAADGG